MQYSTMWWFHVFALVKWSKAILALILLLLVFMYKSMCSKCPGHVKVGGKTLCFCWEGFFHLGVVVWQLVIEKNGNLDVKRTAVITFLGLVLVGPTLHIWWGKQFLCFLCNPAAWKLTNGLWLCFLRCKSISNVHLPLVLALCFSSIVESCMPIVFVAGT